MISGVAKALDGVVRTVRQKTIDAIWKGVATNSITGERTPIIWHAMCFRFDKRITGSGVTPGTIPSIGYELQGNFNPADGTLQIVKTFRSSDYPTVIYTGRLVESNRIQGEWILQGKVPARGTFDIATESFRWEGHSTDDKTYQNQQLALDIAVYKDGIFGVTFSPQTGVVIHDGDFDTVSQAIEIKQVLVQHQITKVYKGCVKNTPVKHIAGTYSESGRSSGTFTVNKIEICLNQQTLP
jgi:hypothetical protein